MREEGEAESKEVEHFVQVKGQRVWLRNSGCGLAAFQLCCLPAGWPGEILPPLWSSASSPAWRGLGRGEHKGGVDGKKPEHL